MYTYIYENTHKTCLWFFQHFAKNAKPNIKNTFENSLITLGDLAYIHKTLLTFICNQRFFNFQTDDIEKIHTLQLFIEYKEGSQQIWSPQETSKKETIAKIKGHIEILMKDEAYHLSNGTFHLIDEILTKEDTTTHLLGLYCKNADDTYSFYLFDYIYDGRLSHPGSHLVLISDEKYCLSKYQEYIEYLIAHEERGNIKDFCKTKTIWEKTLRKKFRTHFGITLNDLQTRQAMLYGLLLILQSSYTFDALSKMVHYEDYDCFLREFKKSKLLPSTLKRLKFNINSPFFNKEKL